MPSTQRAAMQPQKPRRQRPGLRACAGAALTLAGMTGIAGTVVAQASNALRLPAEEPNFHLNPIFDHGMVLTAPTATIYGRGARAENVTVSLDPSGVVGTGCVNAHGDWAVILSDLQVGGPYALLVQAQRNITLSDVWLGQVFLFTGASNMHHPLAEIAVERRWGDYEPLWRRKAEDEILRGPNPFVRSYIAHKAASHTPRHTHAHYQRWQVARPENERLGALPYLVVARLQPRERMPVGIVQAVAGGTPSHEWLPGESNPERNFYNGMMAPLAGFNFTAVVLSQGESEVDHDPAMARYQTRLAGWIDQLRNGSGYPHMPVIIVGSAGVGPKQSVPVELMEGRACANIFNVREAQIAVAQRDSNVAYVATHDLADSVTIHYPNKWDAARRIIEAHRRLVKHAGYPYMSPLLASWNIVDHEVIVRFAERTQPIAPGRRVGCAGPIRELAFEAARGLAIADASYQWQWANASFDGERLHVFAAGVDHPVAARYAWGRNPNGNLYTFPDGLPVASWRTDNLSLVADADLDKPCSFPRHDTGPIRRTGGDLCPV